MASLKIPAPFGYKALSECSSMQSANTLRIDVAPKVSKPSKEQTLFEYIRSLSERERHQNIAGVVIAFSYLVLVYDIHGPKEPKYLAGFERHPYAYELLWCYNQTDFNRWTVTACKVLFMFWTTYGLLRDNFLVVVVGLAMQMIECLLVFAVLVLYLVAYPNAFRLCWMGLLLVMEGVIMNSLVVIIKAEPLDEPKKKEPKPIEHVIHRYTPDQTEVDIRQ